MYRFSTGALALALAASLVPGAAALADTSASVGVGLAGSVTGVGTSPDGRTRVRGDATFTGVINGRGLQVVYACNAQGIGAVAATGISACYVVVDGKRYDARATNLPGPVNAIVQTDQTATAAITVCYEVRAVPVQGDDATDSRCSQEGVGVNLPTIDDLIVQVPR